ncbi:hypothetical protein C7974DRAFT_398280 [Boeremia exigua]|uniref:uncharacterized protein n=1 Tax=Boeremia exigua TaxID=749465 RepID=UPI001E8D0D98|nr:uncharacterized protein C7974DRAFT_398280 [Boeremia exigua]KAH6622431.1 hypothetical protein C7974DRAFT_398280 [Boeremia exigua]
MERTEVDYYEGVDGRLETHTMASRPEAPRNATVHPTSYFKPAHTLLHQGRADGKPQGCLPVSLRRPWRLSSPTYLESPWLTLSVLADVCALPAMLAPCTVTVMGSGSYANQGAWDACVGFRRGRNSVYNSGVGLPYGVEGLNFSVPVLLLVTAILLCYSSVVSML